MNAAPALFITPVAPWDSFGGTATVSRNLIALLSETFDLQVCCLRADAPGDYPRTTEHAIVLSGPVPALARQLKFFFDFSAESFAHRQFWRNRVRRALADLLHERPPELVFVDHIFSAWIADLLPDSARVVFIAHDDMVAYADSLLALDPPWPKRLRFQRTRGQYQALQNRLLQRADLVLTMTDEDATRLRPFARGTVTMAPLFFEFDTVTPAMANPSGHLLVTGSFDTWEKQLGLTRFLEDIFRPLRQQVPNSHLIVAGRIPERLQAVLPQNDPAIRLVHQPTEEEMTALRQHASAGAVLDLQDSGLKIKTLELAAAGLPVVGWPAGLKGTGLVPGRSCLQAESAAEFCEHLVRLAQDPALRQRMGTEARATIASRYARSAARQRLAELLP